MASVIEGAYSPRPEGEILRDYPQVAIWSPTAMLEDMVTQKREYCIYIARHRPSPGDKAISRGIHSADDCLYRAVLCYDSAKGWAVGKLRLGDGKGWAFNWGAVQRHQAQKRNLLAQAGDGRPPVQQGNLAGFASQWIPVVEEEDSEDEERESLPAVVEQVENGGGEPPQAEPVVEEGDPLPSLTPCEVQERMRTAARVAVFGTPCTASRVSRGTYAAKLTMADKDVKAAITSNKLDVVRLLGGAIKDIMVPTAEEEAVCEATEAQARRISKVNKLLLANEMEVRRGFLRTVVMATVILSLAGVAAHCAARVCTVYNNSALAGEAAVVAAIAVLIVARLCCPKLASLRLAK